MIIQFRDKYRWLSNMVLVNIEFDGRTYPSVENAYMSAKSHDEEWKEKCAHKDSSPYTIKRLSKELVVIPEWDDIKLDVMERTLRAKFTQEPFKSLLLETGDQNIQEGNTWGDEYWGVNLNVDPNYGENHLGRLIMKIREELKKI